MRILIVFLTDARTTFPLYKKRERLPCVHVRLEPPMYLTPSLRVALEFVYRRLGSKSRMFGY